MNLQHSLDFEQFNILCKESESFRKSIYNLLTVGVDNDLTYYKQYIKSNFDKTNLIPAVKWLRGACQNDLKAFSDAGYDVYKGCLSLAGAKKFVDECLS